MPNEVDVTDTLDPIIQAWFAETHSSVSADEFIRPLLQQIKAQRRRAQQRRLAAGICILLLSLGLVMSNSTWLMQSLITINNHWLGLAFAPLNTPAGVAAIVLLAGTTVVRRVFNRAV